MCEELSGKCDHRKNKITITIDHSKCIKCGSCIDNCPFGAVYTE